MYNMMEHIQYETLENLATSTNKTGHSPEFTLICSKCYFYPTEPWIGLRAYITLLGRSVWGQLNAYNAVLRENQYLPDMIGIFTEEAFRKNVGTIKEGMLILSEEYGCDPTITTEIVPDGDFMGAGMKISVHVRDLKARGHVVALDITSGRKALVAGALLSTAGIDLDHVFYLLIDTLRDAAMPYPMIPFHRQRLRDFAEGGREEP